MGRDPGNVILRAATRRDVENIRMLLESSGLPTRDLASAAPEFVVACKGNEVIAVGAIERREGAALLRSVTVATGQRGSGLGRLLVQELERRARSAGVGQVVLLTQTAERFFEGLGYSVIDRKAAPRALEATGEFQSLCPATATCMSKDL